MQPTPSFLTLPAFCTSGTRTQPGSSTLASGYTYLAKPPCEEHNFLFGNNIDNTNTAASGLTATMNELNGALSTFGITPNNSVTNQVTQMLYKVTAERGHFVSEILALPYYRAPVAWASDGSTMTTYFPVVSLSDIETNRDITTTQYPDLVPVLRAIRTGYQVNMTGTQQVFNVTNWAIAANVATLTFANTTPEIVMLAALSEDQTTHGNFTNWRTVTLASAIGSITAGDYAITAINAATRQVSFAFTAANSSGAVTSTAEFYAYRIAGSSTSARLYGAQGMSLRSVNDANNYFMAGSLRRRGYFQGHVMTTPSGASGFLVQQGGFGNYAGGGNPINPGASSTGGPVTDGTNGTPRTAKETHGPSVTVFYYMHAGSKIA